MCTAEGRGLSFRRLGADLGGHANQGLQARSSMQVRGEPAIDVPVECFEDGACACMHPTKESARMCRSGSGELDPDQVDALIYPDRREPPIRNGIFAAILTGTSPRKDGRLVEPFRHSREHLRG